MPPSTVMLLIRHGRTDWLGKKLAGRLPGISLNDDGRREAHLLAQALEGLELGAVFASPLERARETAEPLAHRRHLEVQLVEALQEADFGELTGKTFRALRAMPVWKDLHTNPSQSAFPGGETLRAVQRRAVAWADQAAVAHAGQHIAAVSHADTIRLLLAHYLASPLKAFHTITIDPASVSILQFASGKVRVVGMNWPAGSLPLARLDE
jgi:broad specificity phosphatase PhoE